VLLGTQCTMLVLGLGMLVLFPPPGSSAAWVWGPLAGVAQAVGVAALFRGLAIGRMGVVAPLSALAVLVPLSAGLMRGDTLTVVSGIGISAAVVGSVLSGGPEFRSTPERRGARASIVLAVLAAFGFGCSQLLLAEGSTHHVPSTLVATAGTALALYAIAFLVLRMRQQRESKPPRVRAPMEHRSLLVVGVAAIGFLNFGANAVFGFTSTVAPLSLLAVFASLYPLVTALLARAVLDERLKRIQVLGAVLVVAGIALIASGLGASA
jgi:drug/metabolite transporter (DMT)-like permease